MKKSTTFSLSGHSGVTAALLLVVASPAFSTQVPKVTPKPAAPAKTTPAKTATASTGKAASKTQTKGTASTAATQGRGNPATVAKPPASKPVASKPPEAKPPASKRPPRTPPGSIERTKNGGEIHRRPDGHVSVVHTPGGATIHHGLAGNRRVEMQRPDHTRIVSERGGHGYVQHPYMYRGHEFGRRTYYDHGVARDRFYGRYEYRPGIFLDVYAPARYYPVSYYSWAYYPWAAPVAYSWGWSPAVNPWYGYYGSYFTPAPVYPTASLWLTDYLISQSLQSAYQAQVDAAMQIQANLGQAAAINADVKALIAAEVQRQVALETREAQSNSPNAAPDFGSSGIARLLTDHQSHVFVVGRDLDLVDATGLECAVSEGDVLALNTPPPDNAVAANLSVLASKGGVECRKGAQVAIAFPDLQDMQNHMRETIDQGLENLQAHQGQGGLPTAPASAPVQASFAALAPPPDPNAAAQINQQSQEAERAERETLGQSLPGGPSGALSPAPSAAPPLRLTLGLTVEEVSKMLGGQLDCVADLGTKKIYKSGLMKFTFTGGKVTNIE